MQGWAVLGILTFVALLAVIVASSVRRMRELEAAQRRLLAQNGFEPCKGDETSQLEGIVRSLRDSSRFEVRKPWKRRSIGGGEVYWYEVSSGTGDSRSAADEFLCTVPRASRDRFLLYLRPARLEKGLGARLLEKLVTVTAPPGMHKMDLSGDAKSDALLAAFGPRDSSLSDLIDSDKLAVLAQGARHGVLVVRGVGDHCALELYGTHARKAVEHGGWLDTWSFVQRVAV